MPGAPAPSPTTWMIVLLLALMSGLTTLLGVALAIRFEKNARAVAVGIGFLAGIMLLIAGVELATGIVPRRGLLDAPMLRVSTPHELLPMAARLGNLARFGAGLALSVPVYVLLRVIVPR